MFGLRRLGINSIVQVETDSDTEGRAANLTCIRIHRCPPYVSDPRLRIRLFFSYAVLL